MNHNSSKIINFYPIVSAVKYPDGKIAGYQFEIVDNRSGEVVAVCKLFAAAVQALEVAYLFINKIQGSLADENN